MKKRVSNYRHDKIVKFKKHIDRCHIPVGFRMFDGYAVGYPIDIYKVAKEQLNDYFKGKLSLEEIAHPDNILRNAMLLWGIDQKRVGPKRRG